jgi:DNA-binding transcriptional regulator YiaG
MEDFSRFVKQKRKKLGLSQAVFAQMLNTSTVTVWRWENGLFHPRPDAIDYWIKKIEDTK